MADPRLELMKRSYSLLAESTYENNSDIIKIFKFDQNLTCFLYFPKPVPDDCLPFNLHIVFLDIG